MQGLPQASHANDTDTMNCFTNPSVVQVRVLNVKRFNGMSVSLLKHCPYQQQAEQIEITLAYPKRSIIDRMSIRLAVGSAV